jgi:DNA-directed RNA polymerase specialized sigma24 family protein
MSQDGRPGDERGQDELLAAFAALDGRLTWDEFIRLPGWGEYAGALVGLAALLLDGDTATAGRIVQDSLAALQHAWDRRADSGTARVQLCQAVVNRSRSVRRRRIAGRRAAEHAAPGSGPADTGYLGREPWASALRALPDRQREAVALSIHMCLSEAQGAQAMSISTGAARSHTARGMSMLPPPPERR